MKKIILSAVAFVMLFSCQNDDQNSAFSSTEPIIQRNCATQEVLDEQLKADPTLAIRMNQIEAFTQNALLSKRIVDGKIVIPVIVNVLYRTAAENISDSQIQSQIDVLNKDFTATNKDFSNIPAEFATVAANVNITFVLEKTNRKLTQKTS